MIKEAISKVVKGEDLTQSQMEQVMEEIMSRRATDAQIGAFITAMRMKGEPVEESTGAAKLMRTKVKKVHVNNIQ